jgi:hypothetical protein
MIRTCPKCGDYYADASLAFCLADGTPLANVEPMSESWRAGARIIEEKENVLRKQRRKLKWRRVVLTAMTMAMAMMVVFVVAANALIYLRPETDEDGGDKPLTATTAPGDSSPPSTPARTLPTQKPRPTVTPKPNASPTPKETATPPRDVKPPATPTPTPTPPILQSVCSEADKSRERQGIIERYGAAWRRIIEDERRRIIMERMPLGLTNGEASLGTIEYVSTFSQTCTTASLMARYVWQVKINLNGTVRVVPVARQKRFTCEKSEGAWRCR